MRWLDQVKKRIRRYAATYGFTCDGCGGELFDYPTHRLCQRCESGLHFNDGRTCEKCGRATLAEGVCLSCKSHAPRFTKGLSPFIYRGESASFVNRIKTGTPILANYFAERMCDCLLKRFDPMDAFLGEGVDKLLLIPVPLTDRRVRERGYNQASLLAERLEELLHEKGYRVELRIDVLVKTRETAQQKHMGSSSRALNVAGAYHIHDRKGCRGRTVVLVDDIMTTGSTGSECASRFISAGAEQVIFLTGASLPEQK